LHSLCLAAGTLLFANAALFGQVIAGTVVDSVSGAPIGGASIQIVNADKTPYQTTSDQQGAFRIEGVADGTYVALVFKTGFQTPGGASALRRFRVGAGLDPVHLQLSLIPFGKLSGRLFDGDDQPVAGAEVSVMQGIGIGQTVKSDDKGGFSFDGVRPGTYLLSARPPNGFKPPAAVRDEHYGWAKAWFPGVTDASAAQKIVIRPGAEIVGQDFKLRAVPVHTIRGMVRDSVGDPAPNVPLTLTLQGDLKPVDQHAVSGKDGSFELPDLADGKWQVSSEKTTPAGVTLRALAGVTLTGRDADGIDLQLDGPFSVPVEFVAVIKDSTVKIQGDVMLQPEWAGQFPVGVRDKDDNYKVDGVYPGRYRIAPVVAGGRYYLASITMGDREVLGQTVEFSSGSISLRVVYRADGGTIRGTVEECGSATIVVVPEDPTLQHSSLGFTRFARCSGDGYFEIRKLRPGRYYAFAFDQVEQNESAFLSSLPGLTSKAVSVEVKANEAANAELKVTTGVIR